MGLRLGMALAVGAALAGGWLGCLRGPLEPSAGLPEYQEPAVQALPGPALVNVAGGNLLVRRVDLEIDTQLGPFAVGATWNGATRSWTWSFDGISLSDGVFTDASGARYELAALADGAALPGSPWRRAGADAVVTRGGLRHEFAADGALARIRWASSSEPALRLVREPVAGAERVTRIEQCLADGGCPLVYALAWRADGRLAAVSDRAGRRAEFAWDGAGRLVAARDGLDVARGRPGFRYEYGPAGDLVAVTDAEGERVEYAYDGGHRLLRATQIGDDDTGSPARSWSYATVSDDVFTTRYRDPLGHDTVFRYDGDRRLLEVRRVDTGERTIRAWQGRRVASLTTPAGAVTRWSWANGAVVERSDPSGNRTVWAYASGGVRRGEPLAPPVATVADDLGPIERRSYDARGRLVAVADGAGETTRIAYGADEMVASVARPDGSLVELASYGEDGHPRSVTRGALTLPLAYDPVGNATSGLDYSPGAGLSLGGVVARGFDEDRNLAVAELADLQYLLPSGTAELRVEFRSDGRPLRVTRPHGGDAEWVYDALGRLRELRERASGTPGSDGSPLAAWQTTRFSYDAAGRVLAIERPNGMRETWRYDAAGRVCERALLRDGSLESSASLSYRDGQLAEVHDSARPGAERYVWEPGTGRLARIEFPDGEWAAWSYDLRSRPEQMRLTHPAFTRTFSFGYDAAGRRSSLRDGGRLLLDEIVRDGHLAEVRYGNGLVRRLAYDPVSQRFAGAETTDALGDVVAATLIEEDDPVPFAALRVHAVTTTHGGLEDTSEERYELGPAGAIEPLLGKRLVFWSGDAGAASVMRYDELGNLLGYAVVRASGTREVVPLLNPEHNRLLAIADASSGEPVHRYRYDEAGFVTLRDDVPVAWDAAGRIRRLGDTWFGWDSFGRATYRVADGRITRFLFGGLVEADAGQTPERIELGEVSIALPSGAASFRHPDLRGNVKFVTDDAGHVVAHHHYGPWGPTEGGAGGDPLGFARGRDLGGLVLLGHRVLDPDAARFLAPDPDYQLVNPYSYTLGNPLWYWDPGGTEPFPSPMGANASFADIPWPAPSISISGKQAAPYLRLAGYVLGLSGQRALGTTLVIISWKLEWQSPPEPQEGPQASWTPGLPGPVAFAPSQVSGPGIPALPPLPPPLPPAPGTGPCGGDACPFPVAAPGTPGGPAAAPPGGCFAPAGGPDLRSGLLFLLPLTVLLGWRVHRERCAGGQSR